MLTIRNTEIADAQSVTECIQAVASERKYLASTDGFSTEQTRAYVAFIKSAGGVHRILLDDERVVGWCDVAPSTHEGMTHVGALGMGLLPEYRGKGWGFKLLSQTVNAAFEQNLERIGLEVFLSNEAAITLYCKVGFLGEGRKRKARKLDDAYEDIMIFGLLREEWAANKE